MAQIIKAPSTDEIKHTSVFLAGGISNCEDWQEKVAKELEPLDNLTIINPRNDNFDLTDINASAKQIKWEFERLEQMDIFSMYFCNSGSVQPICLYELGRNIVRMQMRFPNDWDKRIVISIEDGYARQTDVIEQVQLCAPKIWINANANTHSHAMRIGESLAHIERSK